MNGNSVDRGWSVRPVCGCEETQPWEGADVWGWWHLEADQDERRVACKRECGSLHPIVPPAHD